MSIIHGYHIFDINILQFNHITLKCSDTQSQFKHVHRDRTKVNVVNVFTMLSTIRLRELKTHTIVFHIKPSDIEQF